MLGPRRKILLLLPDRAQPAVWDTVTQAATTIRAVTWAIPAYTAPDGSPGLCEAAVYNTSGVLLGRSGVRDLPPGGTTVTFGLLPIVWAGGDLVVSVWLSENAADEVALASDTFPALSGKPRLSDADGGLGDVALVTRADYVAYAAGTGGAWWCEVGGAVFWLGADSTAVTGGTGHAWGNAWDGSGLVESTNAGTAVSGAATWDARMALPTLDSGEAFYWLEIDRSSTPRLIALTSLGRIFVSNNLTSGATWTDVTPSIKHANGIALAWCMAVWESKVWYGEYTATSPGEIPGGPSVYYCPLASLAAGGWTRSLLVAGGRHIHAIQPDGGALYVVVGDAGFVTGIWRLETAGIGGGPGDGGAGSDDDWSYVAQSGSVNFGEGRPSVYPVSVAAIRNTPGIADVLLGTGDQPGTHVTTTPLGGIGSGDPFAVGIQIQQPDNGESGQTARVGLVDSIARTFYYTTAENVDPAEYILYGMPPPYIQNHPLMASFPGLTMRGVHIPGWKNILNARQRWPGVIWGDPVDWFHAGGAPLPDALYDATLASSLATSYKNLIRRDALYDLTLSGSAPAWDAVNGWDFNAVTGGLLTGIVVPAGGAVCVVVQFTNATDTSGARALFGARNSSSDYYTAGHYWNGDRIYTANRSGSFHTPAMTSGTMMVTQDAGYRNGVSVTAVNGLLVESPQMAIGALNQTTGLANYCNARIKRLAVWIGKPINATQALAIHNALAAL